MGSTNICYITITHIISSIIVIMYIIFNIIVQECYFFQMYKPCKAYKWTEFKQPPKNET